VDPKAAEDLVAAFLEFDRSDARVTIFTGAGGAFCAGWDLKYAASLAEGGAHEMHELDFPLGSAPARAVMGIFRESDALWHLTGRPYSAA